MPGQPVPALGDVDIDDVEAEYGVDRTDEELFLAGLLEDDFETVVDHRVDVLVEFGHVCHSVEVLWCRRRKGPGCISPAAAPGEALPVRG